MRRYATALGRRLGAWPGGIASTPRRLGLGVAAVVVIVAGLGLVLPGGPSRDDPRPAADFGERVVGQRIYDRTGLLSATDLGLLDQRAGAIERAGVPVVVYIRDASAGDADTRTAAGSLMTQWAVETAPGAGDGLVLLLDIDFGQDDGGAVALVPGEQLKDRLLAGQVSDRITAASLFGSSDVVASASGVRTAVDRNLSATERRLVLGVPAAPTPSVAERTAVAFARYLLPVIGVLVALAAAVAVASIRGGRRAVPCRRSAPTCPEIAGRTRPTGDEPHPALWLALAAGRTDAATFDAALARLLAIGAVRGQAAPIGPTVAAGTTRAGGADGVGAIALGDRSRLDDPIDRAAWDDLARVAVGGTVEGRAVAALADRAPLLRAAITAELERRGWWDGTARQRAVPLIRTGQGVVAVAALTLLVALAADEPRGLLSLAVLLPVAAMAWRSARTVPRLTPLGRAAASGQTIA